MRRDVLIPFLIIIVIILAIAGCRYTRGASAHEWYPSGCCSDKDCYFVEEARITDDGTYYILDHKFKFLKSAKKYSPDGRYHVCISGQNPKCIFVPEPEI